MKYLAAAVLGASLAACLAWALALLREFSTEERRDPNAADYEAWSGI